jgi:hypothetical protein
MKSYTLWTGIGLLLGFVVVWWVQPNNSGATFLVVVLVILCNLIGILVMSVSSSLQKFKHPNAKH